MASWKEIVAQYPTSAKKISPQLKSNAKYKVQKVVVGPAGKGLEDCISLEVVGIEGLVRLNKTSLLAISTKYGDEIENWEGKSISISAQDVVVNNKTEKSIIVKPA